MTKKERILISDGRLEVPNNPTIHYIEGDGIGTDITPVMISVVNSAVHKAYNGNREINWSEALAGQKAFDTAVSYTHLRAHETLR